MRKRRGNRLPMIGLCVFALAMLTGCTTIVNSRGHPQPEEKAELNPPQADSGQQTAPAPAKDRADTITLGNLITSTRNPAGARPKGRQFYAALAVRFSEDTPVKDNTCIDKSVWSFIRKVFNNNQAASSGVSVQIAPIGNDHPTLSVPLFLSKVDENPQQGAPPCLTKILGTTQITAFVPSKGDGFKLTFAFDGAKTVDSTLMQSVATKATSLVNLLATATGGLALVSDAATKVIVSVATDMDNARKQLFNTKFEDGVGKAFHFFPPGDPTNKDAWEDAWTVSIKDPVDTRIGSKLSGWIPAITVYFMYRDSVIRQSTLLWPPPNEVLTTQMFSSELAQLNTIDDMLRAAEVKGFDASALDSAKTQEEMEAQCDKVDKWLRTFLVGDDVVVARFAVMLKHSKYDKYPQARSGQCFSADDEAQLRALTTTYAFTSPPPKTEDRTAQIKALVDTINDALKEAINGDATFAASVATTPISSFRFSRPGVGPVFGQDAETAFFRSALWISCVQARKDNGAMNVLAAFLNADGKTRVPALLYFSPK